ncbi:ribonuclease domain-containing protein [Aeribacillus pallidus]|nr:ribonuclease domain-containing protein [Aeribacillus pallidus]
MPEEKCGWRTFHNVKGKNRGAERVVINQHNGRVYYTKNHYKTFRRIR